MSFATASLVVVAVVLAAIVACQLANRRAERLAKEDPLRPRPGRYVAREGCHWPSPDDES